jgi:hypothetical protein
MALISSTSDLEPRKTPLRPARHCYPKISGQFLFSQNESWLNLTSRRLIKPLFIARFPGASANGGYNRPYV